MKKDKLNINIILNHWYIIKSLDSIDALYFVIPIEEALEKLIENHELRGDDFTILDAYQKGYNIREIAKITKISRQTVSTRLDSIVKRLETLIGADFNNVI